MTEAELQVARHEAGHVTASLCQGIPVRAARRWTPDPRRDLGATYLNVELDRELAGKWAIMLLAGPAMADQPLPTWPLGGSNGNDEHLLRILCEYLELDERGYERLVGEMWSLSAMDTFERLFRVVTSSSGTTAHSLDPSCPRR